MLCVLLFDGTLNTYQIRYLDISTYQSISPTMGNHWGREEGGGGGEG